MATPHDAKVVQERLRYKFKDENILIRALTAAGKGGNQDGSNIRGNSRLAHLGGFLIQFLLAYIGFGVDSTRGDSSNFSTRVGSASNCVKVAERADLDKCLKYDIRGGGKSALVLRKAINAIAAAIFIDSKDFDQVLEAMLNLGLFAPDDVGVDPRMLSLDHTSVCGSIHDMISICFKSGIGRTQTQNDDRTDNILRYDIGLAGPQIETQDPANLLVAVEGPTDTLAHAMSQVCQETNCVSYVDPLPSSQSQNMDRNLIDSGGLLLYESTIFEGLDLLNVPDPDTLNQDLTSASPEVPPLTKRRKVASGTTSTESTKTSHEKSTNIERQLDAYIAEEAQRCIAHGLPIPQKRSFETLINARIGRLKKNQGTILMLIQACTGGSYSVAALMELARSHNTQHSLQDCQIRHGISMQDRFGLIRRLDERIALNKLLRRYHVFHLYEECLRKNHRAAAEFIPMEPSHPHQPKKAGNPGNNAKSEVTRAMLKEIYPDLNDSMPDWNSKYNMMTRLQTLGRRFQTLINRFGNGILGLMPFGGLAEPFDLEITDTMIGDIPEKAFATFVAVIDEVEGQTLRTLSNLVSIIIDPLVYGSSGGAVLPPIQNTPLHEILQYPKGSDALLGLLSP
ncbi:hypothetical protein BDV26DRAFT_287931 [Aspergillus bertholletiae]|uniref:RNase III domain-containing protein n=1 Tax=Aspergillus bertholletiae TaxID=1226010 RepID=A0A5N7BMU0_9EURO|nr:hypothetical protein BDV26DRAFT_287931 [Aspergillus bertholletiae]